MKNSLLLAIRVIAICMLLLALTANQYGYYTFLRWVICSISAYCVYLSYKEENSIWLILFIAIAILFNPIAPIYLYRNIWQVLDLITGTIFIISIFVFKIRNNV